jgi:hypothetical protein
MRYTERESKAAVKSPISKPLCYSLVIGEKIGGAILYCSLILLLTRVVQQLEHTEKESFLKRLSYEHQIRPFKVLSHLSISQHRKFSKLKLTQALKISAN